MEKREVRYLINYKKEVYSLIKKYDLQNDLGKIDATMEIKNILLIDENCAINNNCTIPFQDILRLIKEQVELLESDMLFDCLSYIECIIDMLKIYEKNIFIQL